MLSARVVQLQVFASYFVHGFLSLFAAMGLQQSASSSLPTAAPSLANTHITAHRSLSTQQPLSARRDTTSGAGGYSGAAAAASGSGGGGSLSGFGSFGYFSGASSNSNSSAGLRAQDGLLHGHNR